MRNKEQEILEAAEREFIAKGFAGARTTSIAEAAGVTNNCSNVSSTRRCG